LKAEAPELSIRAAVTSDTPTVLSLADRLPAFGPTTRAADEIIQRERAALADALSHPSDGSAVLVAVQPPRSVVGVILLDSRRDYFTNEAHGHVSILAVAREAEGQGVGRALLKEAEDWARSKRFSKLTLAVFTDNHRAKEVYGRQGWRPELETWYNPLPSAGASR
jgi:GNAT superfamily N-acetyltransferase